ncbi:hypothetical protein [Streptomyces sp. NPDC020917]|uniref:hypothetical protein n=1 Tax=Streptomyces sp. NPDC020917 TaxID=3365102 RepID=UPI0037A2C96E
MVEIVVESVVEIVVETENGERHVRVSAEELAGLTRWAGGRAGWDPGRAISVTPLDWRRRLVG